MALLRTLQVCKIPQRASQGHERSHSWGQIKKKREKQDNTMRQSDQAAPTELWGMQSVVVLYANSYRLMLRTPMSNSCKALLNPGLESWVLAANISRGFTVSQCSQRHMQLVPFLSTCLWWSFCSKIATLKFVTEMSLTLNFRCYDWEQLEQTCSQGGRVHVFECGWHKGNIHNS